ncbi:MAG: toxin-antitoxin system YwqK family antitoxin [Crocinitomicaceae bacterium]|nr:toxin-antitoxin system YwqK family antitoxin [Crocinitomicaceae bacterium]
MKYLTLLILSMSIITSCAQDNEKKQKNTLAKKENLSEISVQPNCKKIDGVEESDPWKNIKERYSNYTGIIKKCYDNGKVEKFYTIKNGKQDGKARAWHKNGKLAAKANFQNGEVDGVVKRWYENGNIEGEAFFKNGNLNGKSLRYYNNGNLKEEASFIDGKPRFIADEALMTKFYPDGQAWIIYHDSTSKTCYDPTGLEMTCTGNYTPAPKTNINEVPKPDIILLKETGGPLNQGVFELYENGDFWYFQNYKNGLKEGLAFSYYKNGKKMYMTNYVNGKESGLQRQWHENGQLKSESNEINDARDGISKTWDKNGVLRLEQFYKEGKPHGIQKVFDENGLLKLEGVFNMGKKVGENCYDKGKKINCQ